MPIRINSQAGRWPGRCEQVKGSLCQSRNQNSNRTSAIAKLVASNRAASCQPKAVTATGAAHRYTGARKHQMTNRSVARSQAVRPSVSVVWKSQLARSSAGRENR